MTTRTHGPPRATIHQSQTSSLHFGLDTNAAGRYNFVDKIGNAGAFTTQVHGRGVLLASRA